MFRAKRGSTLAVVLIVAVAVVVAGALYWHWSKAAAAPDTILMYHCNACSNDFKVDLSQPGGAMKPACPKCNSTKVTMVP